MSQKRTRRVHDSHQKATILRRHLIDKISVSDLCDEYSLQPSVFYKWQKDLFDHAPEALEPKKRGNATIGHSSKKIEKLEKKLEQKNEVIAELMQEHITLKKECGEI